MFGTGGSTLCIYKDWGKNVNYDGPIDDENSTCNPLGGGGPDPYSYIAWNSDFGVDIFFGQAGRRSSVDRQMGAYKYIRVPVQPDGLTGH